MKKGKKNNTKQIFVIRYRHNKDLDRFEGKSLFPEKVARANKLLKGIKLP